MVVPYSHRLAQVIEAEEAGDEDGEDELVGADAVRHHVFDEVLCVGGADEAVDQGAVGDLIGFAAIARHVGKEVDGIVEAATEAGAVDEGVVGGEGRGAVLEEHVAGELAGAGEVAGVAE